MSIPLKLFLVLLDGNGNAFPETPAQSGAYFQLRIVDVEIPFSVILKLAFIDKLYLHVIRHYFAFTKNIRSRSALMRTSRKTYFRSRAPSINNFSGIDIPRAGPGVSLSVPLFSLATRV